MQKDATNVSMACYFAIARIVFIAMIAERAPIVFFQVIYAIKNIIF